MGGEKNKNIFDFHEWSAVVGAADVATMTATATIAMATAATIIIAAVVVSHCYWNLLPHEIF